MNSVHIKNKELNDSPSRPVNRRRIVDNADAKGEKTSGSRRYLWGVAIAIVGLGLTMLTGCGELGPGHVPAADARRRA